MRSASRVLSLNWTPRASSSGRPADGSGPKAGARVVTFGWTGARAEFRAVDTSNAAAVPDTVDRGAASALPVAGVTALQALASIRGPAGLVILVCSGW
jgi:NADPH:quinone reductase-like Zn-dependent oxidoreductase